MNFRYGEILFLISVPGPHQTLFYAGLVRLAATFHAMQSFFSVSERFSTCQQQVVLTVQKRASDSHGRRNILHSTNGKVLRVRSHLF